MGYANTKMVIYGIKLNDEQARKIEEELEKTAEEGCGLVLSGNSSYEISIYSEDTDSRIHRLDYDEGYAHVFGINYCSNGYGADDDIVKGIKKIPKKVIDSYENYAKEFLKSLKINKVPKVIVINQVH